MTRPSLVELRQLAAPSKVQAALLRVLEPGAWVSRAFLDPWLVEQGVLAGSVPTVRVAVQKALTMLDKKVAVVNADQGTTWVIRRRRGRGLRLLELPVPERPPSLDDRVQALERRVAELEARVRWLVTR